jgi:5-methyltetrahydrofolate--homocysteine methyltransferase
VQVHRPDIVGLSGLLVKSAQQMVATAEDLSRAGVSVPILVGGAALSRNFVDKQIAPAYPTGTVAYAQDAMSGLELAKQLMDPAQHEALKAHLHTRRTHLREETQARPAPVKVPAVRSAEIPLLESIPQPPDYDRHVLTNTPLDQVWRFVNPVMLYGRHFGVKGSAARMLGTPGEAKLAGSEDGRKALEMKATLDSVKDFLRPGVMRVRAVFKFFKAASVGNQIHVFDGKSLQPVTVFDFPRQEKAPHVCLSDLLAPFHDGKPQDNLCMFVVTAGEGVRELAEKFKTAGDFVKMHAVQALALETAEAYAELLHAQLRSMWGQPDPPELTMLERFRAEYSGKRYSFGYPACPRLEDQQLLFHALGPEDIGVRLTDGCMMEPEASVSALVFHHPAAFYFSVS